MLVPAAYRCPDHDNVDEVTARVRELVEFERRVHADTAAAEFHVSVICPGRGADPGTAHRRRYDGTWRVA